MSQGFFDFAVTSIDGSPDLLGPLKGQVVLAVNVASRCGYTPQYSGLEQLYRGLRTERFAVVGFPCNQFGAQEPGSEQDIMKFCSVTYDVTFPMSAKLEVNGAGRHPLYAWLTAPANGFPGDIGWNFEKFLVNRKGEVVARFATGVEPSADELVAAVKKALDEK